MFHLLNFMMLISILSQVRDLPGWITDATRGAWLLFLLFLIMRNNRIPRPRFGVFFIWGVAIIAFFLLYFSIFSPLHLQSVGFRLLFPPLLLYFSGYCLQKYISPREMKIIFLLYFIYAAMLMLYVYETYIISVNMFTTHIEYLYASKNSLARIIATGVIFFLVVTPVNRYLRYCSWGTGLIFLFFLLLLRSRASLLGTIIGLLYYMFKKKKFMLLILVSFLFVAYLMMLLEDYGNGLELSSEQTFIMRSLNLDRYEDINRFSGGRLNLFDITLPVIAKNLWVGIGKCEWPVDNFYLSILIQVGLLGCPMFFAITFYRIFLNLRRLPQQLKDDSMVTFLEIITVLQFVVSFFESGGILGSGYIALSLWLLSGYFDAEAEMTAVRNAAVKGKVKSFA